VLKFCLIIPVILLYFCNVIPITFSSSEIMIAKQIKSDTRFITVPFISSFAVSKFLIRVSNTLVSDMEISCHIQIQLCLFGVRQFVRHIQI
jgi:hypothetical protein